ncbi:MAG: class I SAM-dependent methyltransferase [Patescibacteria group bacterium]
MVSNGSADWDFVYRYGQNTFAGWSFIADAIKELRISHPACVLDSGCGSGDHSIRLAKMGFSVWGIDFSAEGIAEAEKALLLEKRASSKPPIFALGDLSQLDQIKEIQGIEFDLIVDNLASQFLSLEDKLRYISKLSSHLKPKAAYLLHVFRRGIPAGHLPQRKGWIRRYALSLEEVEGIWGKTFDILRTAPRNGSKQGRITSFYIMKAK